MDVGVGRGLFVAVGSVVGIGVIVAVGVAVGVADGPRLVSEDED